MNEDDTMAALRVLAATSAPPEEPDPPGEGTVVGELAQALAGLTGICPVPEPLPAPATTAAPGPAEQPDRPEPPVDPLDDEQTGSLTRAEQRVATLAARGYTNREIARRLYITVSTVEQHLTKVYRKLNVRRRRELPTRTVLTAAIRPAH